MINEVLTIKEAADLWGKEVSTLRRVIQGNKFIEGADYRKSGSTWLITREAMERVYGKLEDNMGSKMVEIRNKAFEIVKHEDILEAGEITREVYFYCLGKSLHILQKHTRYKEPINKYLNAASIEVLKDYKRNLIKKYMNEFVERNERNGVEWNIVALTYSYNPDSYTEEDKDILMFGYLDTSKYPKSEK